MPRDCAAAIPGRAQHQQQHCHGHCRPPALTIQTLPLLGCRLPGPAGHPGNRVLREAGGMGRPVELFVAHWACAERRGRSQQHVPSPLEQWPQGIRTQCRPRDELARVLRLRCVDASLTRTACVRVGARSAERAHSRVTRHSRVCCRNAWSSRTTPSRSTSVRTKPSPLHRLPLGWRGRTTCDCSFHIVRQVCVKSLRSRDHGCCTLPLLCKCAASCVVTSIAENWNGL